MGETGPEVQGLPASTVRAGDARSQRRGHVTPPGRRRAALPTCGVAAACQEVTPKARGPRLETPARLGRSGIAPLRSGAGAGVSGPREFSPFYRSTGHGGPGRGPPRRVDSFPAPFRSIALRVFQALSLHVCLAARRRAGANGCAGRVHAGSDPPLISGRPRTLEQTI